MAAVCFVLAGGPLFQGDIEDYKNCAHIRCPWHGYMFELENGKNEIGLMVGAEGLLQYLL